MLFELLPGLRTHIRLGRPPQPLKFFQVLPLINTVPYSILFNRKAFEEAADFYRVELDYWVSHGMTDSYEASNARDRLREIADGPG